MSQNTRTTRRHFQIGPFSGQSKSSRGPAHNGRKGIGSIFTPDEWCDWLIGRFGILERWLNGATLLDPTAGDGRFLRSLIRLAVEAGLRLPEIPIQSLFAVEREQEYVDRYRSSLKSQFGLELPGANTLCADILLDPIPIKADILIGNPPWQNFTELPGAYREAVKPLFLRHGLAGDRRKLLLGGSRIDIATLIIAKTMSENLNPGGNAYFYLPLSLFMNEGANEGFRRRLGEPSGWALKSLHDFSGIDAFAGIATRYCAAHFERDTSQQFPLPFHRRSDSGWEQLWASPLHQSHQSFVVFPSPDGHHRLFLDKVHLNAPVRPRQGVNTCGANDYLLFSNYTSVTEDVAEVTSRVFGPIRLPKQFLYPLMSAEEFRNGNRIASRFVLLPYHRESGKPLTWPEIESIGLLRNYLIGIRSQLSQRRGKLFRSWIDRGYWWALLGVGPYSFTPYKVAWPAYGGTEFMPRIFSPVEGRPWQGNQAQHAFIPCQTLEEAEHICSELSKPSVTALVRANTMQGTRSWAQPGRIASIIAALTSGDV